jgi:hypothetical protein
MSYVNKTFTSNLDGSTVRITEQIDSEVVALDNGQRVSLKRLNDASYYTENIDPSSFFNRDATVYNSFIDRIKSIPDSHIRDTNESKTSVVETGVYTNTPVNPYGDQFYGNKEEVPVYHEDPEEEKRQLLSKYSGNTNATAVMSQAEKLKDLLDDEAQVRIPSPVATAQDDAPVTRVFIGEEEVENTVQSNSNVTTTTTTRVETQTQQTQQTQNPQTQMFKGIKRNTDFKVKLELDNKIPRPDFISMWEDSYEASIIEFLADEFTNALLSNPQYIKDQIITQLRKSVYGEEKKVEKVVKKAPAKKVKAKVENKMTKATEIKVEEKVEEVKTEKKGRKKIQES